MVAPCAIVFSVFGLLGFIVLLDPDFWQQFQLGGTGTVWLQSAVFWSGFLLAMNAEVLAVVWICRQRFENRAVAFSVVNTAVLLSYGTVCFSACQ